MRVVSSKIIKRIHLNNNVIWLVIVLSVAIITGIAIADRKWLYFGVVFIPFILYICIEKPFIFPIGAFFFLISLESLLVV